MNRSKGFIVFGPKDDNVQAKMPSYQAGHPRSSGIYALHPFNGANQVSPLEESTKILCFALVLRLEKLDLAT